MNTIGSARLPNLIIAGARKGGTTSLSQYLSQHPDICSSPLKKAGYFLPLKHGEPLEDLESYAEHFDHCGGQRYRMEATTGYFLGGRTVAAALAETLPDARVVVSLREPVDVLWSYYRFVRSHGRIDTSTTFTEYVDRCRALMETGEDLHRENDAHLGYRAGFYAEPLTEWADTLGDALRVVFFDDLQQDSRSVLADLCEWLGIDPAPVEHFDLDVHNRSVQVRNQALQRMALEVNRSAKRFLRRHHSLKRALRGTYYALNRDRRSLPGLDPDTRARLEAVYAPSNARVAELLSDRGLSGPLPGWMATAVSP